jgi:hypothetical protein
MGLPLHFNKRGDMAFDNYQRIAIIILHIESKKTLRDFIKRFEWSKWKHWLKLKYIPSKSTLHSWIKLFEEQIIRKMSKLFTSDLEVKLAAIDGTGLDSHHRSKHYEKRVGWFPKTPYAKLDIFIDVDTQMILDYEFITKHRHDVKAAEKIFQRNDLDGIVILADRGFDSEPLHELVRSKGGILIAPVRKSSRKTPRGFYRKKCRELPANYHKRSIVETINSVLKRVYIPVLRSRKPYMQEKELAWSILFYNMERSSKTRKGFRFYLEIRLLWTEPNSY